MKDNKTLLYLGLAVGAIIIARKFNLFRKVQFSPAGFSITRDPFRLIIKMQVNNPTGVSARITQINGSIFQNGAFVAQVNNDTLTQIQPFNRSIIALTIKPDLVASLQAILNYRIPFEFVGNAVIDGIPLPLNFTYTF